MNDWISVEDELPPLEEPVWLFAQLCDGNYIWIGGRTDTFDGWLWADCHMTVWFNGEKWDGDMDVDDDYQPTHWMRLPEPLTTKGE